MDIGRGLNRIDAFNDIDTLDAYFQALKKGNEDLKEWRIKQERDIAKEQQRAVKSAVLDMLREKQALEESGVKVTAKLEKELRLKALREYEKERQKKEVETQNKIFKDIYKIQTSYDKKRQKEKAKANMKENAEMLEFYRKLEESGHTLTKQQRKDRDARTAELKEGATQHFTDEIGKAIGNAINNGLNAINQGIESYVKNQQKINTRLMGSNVLYGFDKFSAMNAKLMLTVGTQPYFKTETMLDNLAELVDAGISSNLEQRAFIQTAKDGIATTFDALDSNLLRLIRLQQMDSTALRLGMEASLTRYLNIMTSNTEYMNQTFDNVSEALLEASATMGMSQSLAFEYQVQKWLGTLTGFGLSDATATSIAQAVGYLGSGNIEALGGTNMLNLMTMAASRAGLNIGDILTKGLNESTTNKLMQAMVGYMAEIGSSNSNVVKSELAQTFGLTFSDLIAAKKTNPSSGIVGSVYGNALTMYGELAQDLTTLALRTPIATLMDNMFANSMFSLSQSIAMNPALAALWKVTDMIQQNTGGINLPEIGIGAGLQAAGFGPSNIEFDFDINSSLENLMKLGIVGAGSLGMIGSLISGASSSILPASMLLKLGITPFGTPTVSAGSAMNQLSGLLGSTSGISDSGFVTNVRANTSSSDISGAVMGDVTAQQEGLSAQASDKTSGMRDQAEADAAKNKSYADLEEGLKQDMTTIVSTLGEILDHMKNGEFEVKNTTITGPGAERGSNWYF